MKLESIFHPSDFSAASEVAFAHALKLAVMAKTRFSILHVTDNKAVAWQDFPGVRNTLERWNLIPKGSPKRAVTDLGVRVEKIVLEGEPVKSCVAFLERHPTDLIVLAVHQSDGRMQWLRKGVGKPIAKGAGELTLFIPHGIKGFVSLQDGSVSLRNILIPITTKPRPQPAVEIAASLIRNLQLSPGTISLLHVGPAGDSPSIRIPDNTLWTWNRLLKEGEPADAILETAETVAADLMVMTTDGPDRFLDGLRGTTSERVLRKTRCPILNLPVGPMAGRGEVED
ncbi:MAG: universal stress protein [Pyrinomonadaceae bacterium]